MKKYLLYLGILLMLLSLVSVSSAKEMTLGQGYLIDIPDEYDASYSDSSIMVDASPRCVIMISETALLTIDEKFEYANYYFTVDEFHTLPIGNKMVVEFTTKTYNNGDIYVYFVDTEDSSICLLVNANPNIVWNIEEPSNPVHYIIEEMSE